MCSQYRPKIVNCPICQQSYPPTPLRHRYAEEMVGELQRLREELYRVVVDINDLLV